MLLDTKEMKLATKEGGEIGKAIRHTNSGGSIAYAIGEDLAFNKYGQAVNLIMEYQNYIGFLVQVSTFKYQNLLIPKEDIVEWGIIKHGDIPTNNAAHSNTIVGLLMYGPIGAIVGSAMDNAASQKQSEKPVIGITWVTDNKENAVFLDFPLASWYHKLNDFLMRCIPEHHKE